MEKMKTKLAVFDLDGTLFDTSDVNYYAYKDALAPYGVALDEEYFKTQCNGRHYTEFIPAIMGTAGYLESVHKIKKAAYAKNLDRAKINYCLFDIIRGLKDKYYCAVVTTACNQNAMDILLYFKVKDLFDLIITQEDITRTKPDPQGFLMAMEHFGISPENTLIFEDSDVGIQAARSANASVLVVNQF